MDTKSIQLPQKHIRKHYCPYRIYCYIPPNTDFKSSNDCQIVEFLSYFILSIIFSIVYFCLFVSKFFVGTTLDGKPLLTKETAIIFLIAGFTAGILLGLMLICLEVCKEDNTKIDWIEKNSKYFIER